MIRNSVKCRVLQTGEAKLPGSSCSSEHVSQADLSRFVVIAGFASLYTDSCPSKRIATQNDLRGPSELTDIASAVAINIAVGHPHAGLLVLWIQFPSIKPKPLFM